MPPRPAMPRITHISIKDMWRAIRCIANHSAADVNGLTGELIKIICGCKLGMEAMRELMLLIINDDPIISAATRNRLLATELIALYKKAPATTVRPISLCSPLIKLAERLALHQMSDEDLRRLFPSMQFGIGQSGGADRAAHILQALHDAQSVGDKEWATVNVDFKNAFNAFLRRALAEALFGQPAATVLGGVFSFQYKSPSPLLCYNDGKVSGRLSSIIGVRQGAGLSSLVFANGLQVILDKVQAAFPDVKITALLDDVNISGAVTQVFAAFDMLVRLALQQNLRLNSSKSSVLVRKEASAELLELCAQRQLPPPSRAIKTLGTYIGDSEECMRRLLADKVTEAIELLDKTKHPEITKQNRLKLIQFCAHPKLNYLARVLPPSIARDQFQRFDEAVIRSVCEMLNITEEELHANDDAVLRQIQLPVRSGGLGFRPVASQLSPAAFIAASANSAQTILDLVKEAEDEEVAWEEWQGHATARSLPRCAEQIRAQSASVQDKERLLPAIGSNARQVVRHIADLPQGKKAHLQHGLTALVDEKRAHDLVATFSRNPYDPAQKQHIARLKAICAKWATAALSMFPTQDEYELRDVEFEIMCRLRLGLTPVPASMMPHLHCVCPSKTDLSINFAHLLDCPAATERRGAINAHDVQKDFVALAAEDGGFCVQKEVLYEEYKVKPDVVMVGRDGRVTLVDVSYVNPVAPSHAGVAAGAEFAAAEKRIKDKKHHYRALAGHLNCAVAPFVLERFGGVTKPARDLLKEIAIQTEEVTGNKAGPLLFHLKHAVARNIHRSNAMMVRLALQNAGNFQLERLIREQESQEIFG